MKCPKSEEFFCFTPRSTHCEHNFDWKMHSADSIGVWCHHPRLTLLLNYVMLSSLHLLYMVSTHHSHTNTAVMQAFVWLNSRLMVTRPRSPFLTRDFSKLRMLQTPIKSNKVSTRLHKVPPAHPRDLYSHLLASWEQFFLRLHATPTPLGDRDPSPSQHHSGRFHC